MYEFFKRLDSDGDSVPVTPSKTNQETPTKNPISVTLRIDRNNNGEVGAVQIFGDKTITITIKDVFKSFKMRWNKEEEYWWKLGSDFESLPIFIDQIRAELKGKCVHLNIENL